MARYKNRDRKQGILVPVSFKEQLIPGTFEHTVDEFLDHSDSLKELETRYRNDETGAPAYDPRVLLKVILFSYSRGIFSSRRIAQICRTNVTCMALSDNAQPDFTTIANFVAGLGESVNGIFVEILSLCAEGNLIGGERLAVDGCKLPSNASKEWSGTLSDLANKKRKFEHRARVMMDQHRITDDRERKAAALRASRKLNRKADRIGKFLAVNEPKSGARGGEKQSNVTDNESAKIKTSHGMIQGYNGVALVDEKTQIIIQAEAFGTGQEHDLIIPVLEVARKNLGILGREDVLERATVLADAGYFKESSLKYLNENNVNAYIPDQGYRKRDARFKTMDRHRGRLTDRVLYQNYQRDKRNYFKLEDFRYEENSDTYICPNGKTLRRWGQPKWVQEKYLTLRYGAKKGDCAVCPLRENCIRKAETRSRNLNVSVETRGDTFSEQMKEKMDTPEAREIYARRMGIVEPVFANITVHKGLNRFTLRSKRKVDVQWKLYCAVHNIDKLARYGKRTIGKVA
jgi:transposase